MQSSYLRSGRDYQGMADHFAATYQTGLVALEVFGGCLVHYDELVDRSAAAWLSRVARVTSLDEPKLRAARDRLVTDNLDVGDGARFADLDPRMLRLDDAMRAVPADVVEPGRLAARGV